MIRSKIALINAVFSKESASGRWASQSNAILGIGSDLIDELGTKDTPENRKQVNIIAIGALITALAYDRRKYGVGDWNSISKDPASEFYNMPQYPRTWSELYLACDMDAILKEYDQEKDQRFHFISKENPLFLNMIMKIGSQIMQGKLPFEPKQLNASFPQLNPWIAELDYQINYFEQHQLHIAKTFDAAISSLPKDEFLNQDKKKFKTALITLKENTLSSFKNQDKLFNFDNCMIIANSAKNLTAKVALDTVSQNDINDFNKQTRPFLTSKWFVAVLAALIGAVVGMGAGLLVGGIPGAIAGAVAGGISAASCSMWYLRKNDPLIQLSKAHVDLDADAPTQSITAG